MTQTEQEGMPQSGEEGSSLTSFTSKAIRKPKSGSYEQLLCQHLMTSVSTYSTEKIRLICEAAYMVPETPVDTELLDVIYKVAMSFIATNVKITDPRNFPGVIAWSFPDNKENFDKYIDPWWYSYKGLFFNSDHRNQEDEQRIQKIRDKIHAEDDGLEKYGWKYFFLSTQCGLATSGLEILKAKFVSWAMPECMRMFEQLTKLVDPRIYNELAERVKL